jgi:integrase
MSIYRPRRTGSRQFASEKFYVRVKDQHGAPRNIPGFETLAATRELERRLRAVVADLSVGRQHDPDLERWLDGLPPDMQLRLQRVGLIDSARVAVARDLSALLEEWCRDMATRDLTPHHARQHTARAKRVLVVGCRFRAWSDVRATSIAAYLAGERANGLGASTSNGMLCAAKAFGRWMIATERARTNPVAALSPVRVDPNRRRRRGALDPEQARKLLEAAARGPTLYGMTGPARRRLWLTLLLTALRGGELERLRVCDVRLDATPPTLTVPAASAKARREQTIAIHPALLHELRDQAAGKLGLARLFKAAPRNRWPAMLRADLAKAEIPDKAEDGSVLDVHALRCSAASLLARAGAPQRVAQDLLRHASAGLTAHYQHLGIADQAAALAALPDFWTAKPAGAEAAS